MIDCISGGRLIAGLVVGGGPEYYSFSINPAQPREVRRGPRPDHPRLDRARPLRVHRQALPDQVRQLVAAPVQQPHPEIWIPGVGSIETVDFVASRRYAYMGIPYFHIDVFTRMFKMMREACERHGYEADPLQLGWLVPIFVAETDREARERYEEHFWYFVRRLLPGISVSPPGYTSLKSYQNILKGFGSFAQHLQDWDEVIEGRYAIVGSPATVAERLFAEIERLGVGNLLGLFQLGTLPAADTKQAWICSRAR